MIEFGFWHFVGLLIILSTLGGGAKVLLNHRLSMRKADLKRLRKENKLLRGMLEEGRTPGEIKQLESRIEILETIAVSDEEDLNRRLRELPE